jgi:hypothetical protein
LIQIRSGAKSEADQESLSKHLQALQTKIQEHLDLTKHQRDQAQQRKRELQESAEDEDDPNIALAVQKVEEQLRLLEENQVSCGVVFSQVQSRRSGQDISNVITSDDSKALVGLPERVAGKFNQRVKDVTTERGSIAVVGVYSNDFKF